MKTRNKSTLSVQSVKRNLFGDADDLPVSKKNLAKLAAKKSSNVGKTTAAETSVIGSVLNSLETVFGSLSVGLFGLGTSDATPPAYEAENDPTKVEMKKNRLSKCPAFFNKDEKKPSKRNSIEQGTSEEEVVTAQLVRLKTGRKNQTKRANTRRGSSRAKLVVTEDSSAEEIEVPTKKSKIPAGKSTLAVKKSKASTRKSVSKKLSVAGKSSSSTRTVASQKQSKRRLQKEISQLLIDSGVEATEDKGENVRALRTRKVVTRASKRRM